MTSVDRYGAAQTFAKRFMSTIDGPVIVYSFGYTGFVPLAFQKFSDAKIIWGDCSPPDTDQLGRDTTSRFYADAYNNTEGFLYGWHNALPQTRVPSNLSSYRLVAQPFSPEIVAELRSARRTRGCSADCIGFVLASSDIWSPSSIDQWMTQEQWEGIQGTTKNLLQALSMLQDDMQRPIELIADPAFGQCLLGLPDTVNIRLGQYPQQMYRDLLLSADAVICRASHSVTSAECAAMGVAQIILPMPAYNYMNVDDFTADIRDRDLAQVPDDHSCDSIKEALRAVLDPQRRAELERNAAAEFDLVDRTCNFFDSLESFMTREFSERREVRADFTRPQIMLR